jgi:hypothetical protein
MTDARPHSSFLASHLTPSAASTPAAHVNLRFQSGSPLLPGLPSGGKAHCRVRAASDKLLPSSLPGGRRGVGQDAPAHDLRVRRTAKHHPCSRHCRRAVNKGSTSNGLRSSPVAPRDATHSALAMERWRHPGTGPRGFDPIIRRRREASIPSRNGKNADLPSKRR